MNIERKCDHCGRLFMSDTRNLKRGWGRCCSKSCAASLREKSRPDYNAQRVSENNMRRACWNEWWDKDSGNSGFDYPEGDYDQWGDMELGIHE